MPPIEETRPDPDALLHALKKEEEKEKKAKLKIFFGMCAGVGKTYEMLQAGHEAKPKRVDVVIGYVETHKRPETEALLQGLPIIPRRKVDYRGATLEEMDLDAILARKPRLVLVDELAHTNAPGSRHTKRYQDVQELLDSGIDVYSTLNVQHLESRADTVAQITGSTVRETVPDSIFELASEIELIDIPPDELLKRLSEGKVYAPERSRQAIQNFFREGNLISLREMALRLTAERVDHQLRDYMKRQRVSGPWGAGQRLLVAISPSSRSASLIRWARRMAYTMDASWIAVHVETAKRLSASREAQLTKNLNLARELGAEIIVTADEDIADGLVRVARRQNASPILIGKPRHPFPFRKSLLDRVIKKGKDLDVYVVSARDAAGVREKRLRLPDIQSGLPQYAVAAAAVGVVALLCFPATSFLGYQTVSLFLLLTVALLPLRLGAGPVLLAATLSALVWDYFFIPPRFTFVISVAQDILMLVAYFAIAAVAGVLTARVRAREKAVRQREERATALYTLARDLSNARSQDEVAGVAVSNIKRFFNAEVGVFLSELDGDVFSKSHPASTFSVDAKEFGVAAWVYWNERKAGRFTDTLPFATATYYSISGPRYPLGVVGIKLNQENPLSIDQETLLQTFISQIGSALEREQLNELTKQSITVMESERLYKTLFDSLSHELRTPIAAIMSASDSLLDEKPVHHVEMQRDLLSEIHTGAERLNRLIENLLNMARLESGRITPALDWCDVNDLVNTAVRKLSDELSNHVITIDVPNDMPLVKMDFALMEQVITNLLHNACLYTPAGSKVEVRAFVEDDNCVVVLSDNGAGFPRDALPRVFEKFYRVPGSMAGGTGLGLSIVRGFVEAHRGTIQVENKDGGGARFTIRLPLQSETQAVLNHHT
ncbi:MAG: sensor histidine kinase KdpD [Bacteroidota bacterium]